MATTRSTLWTFSKSFEPLQRRLFQRDRKSSFRRATCSDGGESPKEHDMASNDETRVVGWKLARRVVDSDLYDQLTDL